MGPAVVFRPLRPTVSCGGELLHLESPLPLPLLSPLATGDHVLLKNDVGIEGGPLLRFAGVTVGLRVAVRKRRVGQALHFLPVSTALHRPETHRGPNRATV